MAYTLSYNKSSVLEGSSVIITLSNTGLPDGTLVPFIISGTNITPYDFIGLNSLSGNFLIKRNTGSIVIYPSNDLTTEGLETIILRLTGTGRSENIAINLVDTSPTSNITAEFSIIPNKPTIAEGETFVFTITGKNVPVGTVVPYQIFGIQNTDVYNVPMSGDLIFAANSTYDTTANVTLTAIEDFITDGTENIALLLYPTIAYTLAINGTTYILDSSTELSGVYSIEADKSKVIENDSITFFVTGKNIQAGTNVSYRLAAWTNPTIDSEFEIPGDLTIDDFENLTSLEGKFPPLHANDATSNIASVTFKIKDDFVFEPSEYFYMVITTPEGYQTSSAIIEIVDSGNSYLKTSNTYTGNVNVSFIDKAILSANIGAISNKPGFWTDSTGQVSESMVLQGKTFDNTVTSPVFYQPFSYVIRSKLSIDSWENTVKSILHPAGFVLFSEINNETDPNSPNYANVNIYIDDTEINTYSTVTIDSQKLNVGNVVLSNEIQRLSVDATSFPVNIS